MMKISSLTLILVISLGIFLLSAPSFSQDSSDRAQTTQSDYLSMDKQISILNFRLKELEKNNDKIGTLRSDIQNNKLEIQWLHTIVFSWYGFITVIVSIVTIIIGIFTYSKTKNMAEEKSSKWLKDHEKEVLESIETQASTWLTNNKNEVIQRIKDTLSTEFVNSLDRKDGQALIREVIRDEISQLSNDPAVSIKNKSQNKHQELQQGTMDSENLIEENSITPAQNNSITATTGKNSEEQGAVELFNKALNGHGIEKISAYTQLIIKFRNSQDATIILLVLWAYFDLIDNLDGQERINIYYELIEHFKNTQNEEILPSVAKAYLNLGNVLDGQERINTYRELIEHFKNTQNDEILSQVAKAYWNLALALKDQEKINTYRELIKHFKNSQNDEILLLVAKAYLGLALALKDQEKINTYRELIKHFKNSQNDEILLLVAKAYLGLALALKDQERINTYHELIERFKNAQDGEILLLIANAYWNLANALININQRSEAIQLLSEAINRVKDSDGQAIQLQLAKMQFLYNSLIQNS